ncbi:MAG: hypothetical protein QXQ18_01670 [Candidatus Aenigmatarchaeota archaeon]
MVRKISNKKRHKIKISFLNILLIVLLAILVVRVATTQFILSTLNEKLRPAEIMVTVIENPNCTECVNYFTELSRISDAYVKIKENKTLSFSSVEGKQLVQKYNIRKLPTIVVTGEINKTQDLQLLWGQLNGDMKNSSLVIIEPDAPYFDLSTDSVKGLVKLTKIVDSSCEKCAKLDNVINQFRSIGVRFVDEKDIDYTSSEAQSLMQKFAIRRIPAMILSKDITEYRAIQSFWSQLNATLKEGFYALHTTIPPYRDLETNTIKGLVELILLIDNSCTTCYNVSIHKSILSGMGIVIVKESNFDISSDQGKSLISKYNITAVPTILLSPDVIEYTFFASPTATQLFTKHADGWFVFTSTDWMRRNGGYKDLTTGSVITR